MDCPLCGQESKIDGVVMVPDRRMLFIDGVGVKFTGKEALILGTLLDASPRTLSRDRLMDAAYSSGPDDEPFSGIIPVFVSNIRNKLAGTRVHIVSEWGVGWYLQIDPLPKSEAA